MAHRGAGILFLLSFQSFHKSSIPSIFISVGMLLSFSLNILPLSQGVSLSIEEKVGLWSVRRQVAEPHSITYWDHRSTSVRGCLLRLTAGVSSLWIQSVQRVNRSWSQLSVLRYFHSVLVLLNIITLAHLYCSKAKKWNKNACFLLFPFFFFHFQMIN